MITFNEVFESSVKYLTIIGNGFDLSCKLKSSYNDFYNQRYNSQILSFFENRYFNKISTDAVNDLGLIDFILLSNIKHIEKEILWSNIETEILSVCEEDSPYSIAKLAKHYTDVFVYQSARSKLTTDEELATFLNRSRILECLITKKILPNAASSFNNLVNKKRLFEETSNVLELEFGKSISSFENNFKKYLQECMADSLFYEQNAKVLFETIIEEKMLPDTFNKSYVISFNYTSPLNNYFYEFNNIHGNFSKGSDIIFGIDEENIDVTSSSYKFTKTYRKIMLDSSLKKQVKPLLPKINQINFFGHSLSEADYSYFQSIFDYYNIYDSSISINFYYSNYTESMLETTINQVSKLLKKYGNTLDNKNHGKNLLHKLNLEGRLKINMMSVEYENDKIIKVST